MNYCRTATTCSSGSQRPHSITACCDKFSLRNQTKFHIIKTTKAKPLLSQTPSKPLKFQAGLKRPPKYVCTLKHLKTQTQNKSKEHSALPGSRSRLLLSFFWAFWKSSSLSTPSVPSKSRKRRGEVFKRWAHLQKARAECLALCQNGRFWLLRAQNYLECGDKKPKTNHLYGDPHLFFQPTNSPYISTVRLFQHVCQLKV